MTLSLATRPGGLTSLSWAKSGAATTAAARKIVAAEIFRLAQKPRPPESGGPVIRVKPQASRPVTPAQPEASEPPIPAKAGIPGVRIRLSAILSFLRWSREYLRLPPFQLRSPGPASP